MAVDKFEVGKYYRFIGPKSFNTHWNEDMDNWKDGKPRVCLSEKDHSATTYGMGQDCSFADIRDEWWYLSAHREVFEEVEMVKPWRPEAGKGIHVPTEEDLRKRVLSDL
jgi:hypothetical protein